MQLTADCTLVASGYLGFGISDPWDGHAYLLTSGREAVLIDTGAGRAPEQLLARVRTALEGRTLMGVLVTHGHVDHSGGTADLAGELGAPVFASALTAQWLAVADEEAIGLPEARRTGVYPADQVLHAVAGVEVAERIAVGSVVVHAVPTPGHSADHTAYLAELPSGRALFSGDLVFAQGRTAVLDTPDTDEVAYLRSLRAVDELGVAQLFPGHGAVALSAGDQHIRAAVAAYAQGGRPAGLVA
ncbi:MBL fold metallo-hydrolase [Microbacterium sp. NPDC028030]|uniref:MBL fold metallo-hydrolase n=1 Tax=Microbacterium sp. NPDC028030 TaxID=3155124 RepID=UPI0033CB2DF4